MVTNGRIEIRIAAEDKASLAERAEAEGISLSALMRRGIRMAMGQPIRLKEEDALEVVALRRRFNALSAQLDALGRSGPEVVAMRRSVDQAVHDVQALLGRDR